MTTTADPETPFEFPDRPWTDRLSDADKENWEKARAEQVTETTPKLLEIIRRFVPEEEAANPVAFEALAGRLALSLRAMFEEGFQYGFETGYEHGHNKAAAAGEWNRMVARNHIGNWDG